MNNILLFVIATLVIIIIGFWWDIKPKYIQWAQLHSENSRLKEELTYEASLIKNEINIKNKIAILNRAELPFRYENKTSIGAELLATILRAGELSGLAIESIEPMQWQTISGFNTLTFQLFAEGKFSHFTEFLEMLNQSSLPVTLTDFILHAQDNSQLQIKLKLMSGYVSNSQPGLRSSKSWKKYPTIAVNSTHDPFISSLETEKGVELSNHIESDELLLRSIPFRQFKYVGYVQQKKHCWALVMLPNHKTVNVSEKDILGVEGAKIVAINEYQLLVDLNGCRLGIKR